MVTHCRTMLIALRVFGLRPYIRAYVHGDAVISATAVIAWSGRWARVCVGLIPIARWRLRAFYAIVGVIPHHKS